MTTRFMILMPWGRVGSNTLFAILHQSTKSIRLKNENLNASQSSDEQIAVLEEFYRDDPAKLVDFIGTKQSVRASADLKRMAGWLLKNEVKVVRLRRDNIVKATISQIRAEIYAKKLEQETGTPLWGVRPEMTPLGRTEIDIGALMRRLPMIAESNMALLGAFRSTDVLDLEYEQFNIDMNATVVRTREYIGLPYVRFTIPFVKATPDDPSEVVTNYADICERLKNTPYAAML